MPKAKKESAKRGRPKKPKYAVTITMNAETEVHTGEDIHEILKALPVPPAIKTDMTISVEGEHKTAEHVVAIRDARRMFHNSTAMELLAVNLYRRLG
jgi:hypothetical protein